MLCDECPCREDEDCEQAVDDKVDEMLLEVVPGTQTPLWDLVSTHTCDYQCAVWAYDDEHDSWSLTSRASGHLLVALTYGVTVDDTAEGGYSLLTYAKTLINTQTLIRRTIGCQCRVSNHECKHRMVTLNDYAVAGTLPVWEPGTGETYSPSDGCRVDSCELLKLKLTTAQLWHGGTLMGEGYYDWLLTPQWWESANYRYQPFLMAVKWSNQSQGYSITYINCECTGISTHVLASGETCLEYAGICTLADPCIAMMLLHNKAEQNGWTWHGEGVLAHLAKATVGGTVVAYGDWYAVRDQSWSSSSPNGSYTEGMSPAYTRALCGAATPDGYWLISCGCGGPTYYAKNEPVSGYYRYFELPGVCACSMDNGYTPDRELLLAYPQEFGVTDVVWGNDNKFNYTYTSTWYDMDTGQTVTSSYSGCGVCGYVYEPVEGTSGRTMYIDYRAMCFIGSAFDRHGSVKSWLRIIYPPGSQGAPWRGSTRQYFTPPTGYYIAIGGNNNIYDTVSFTGGQYTPFTDDPEIGYTVTYSNGSPTYSNYGLKFSGFHYTWSQGDTASYMYINGCQPTETCSEYVTDRETAEEEAGCDAPVPAPCILLDTTSSHLHTVNPVLAPDFTVVDHPCSVHSVPNPYEPGEVYYCWTPRWFTVGANAGTYQTQYGTGCAWLMLHICYVYTNYGLIIKGLNEFRETYTLPGVSRYPQYTNCSAWDYYDREEGLPGDIQLICHVDTDMHFCVSGFDLSEYENANE